ncbi:TonB-dependent receptor [Caulobacter sp. KR2-114]|uniref:TonB-dependent receptor n=1 Tax=Caulobacter sp. KR2-114 TaxID=3400912 RepID=UPI003BFED99A
MSPKFLLAAGAAALAAGLAGPALAADADAALDTPVAPVEVIAPPSVDRAERPVKTESITASTITATVNAVNTEDALKYLPGVLIRKRHIGDTQAPLATRTSGVGSSARSLIYADGVLLSALIGNNNTTASPRWGMVAPQEIARIDLSYGPFAAAYPGNAIGSVVEITTRMPDHLAAGLDVTGAWQAFNQYATHRDLGSGQVSGYVGDRFGRLSVWVSANHLDTTGQPLSFVTVTQPSGTSASGTPVTGAIADLNRTGAAIQVLGAGSIEHQLQDNGKIKLALDLGHDITASYQVGLFSNRVDATAQSYLTDAAGAPVYAGALNIGGRLYTVAASAFSNGVYRYDETHVMQAFKLASHKGGAFDWEAIASVYDYDTDRQRTPTTALPAAQAGDAGSITDMAGTGWATFDLKGVWRLPSNELSFGFHGDRYRLVSDRYNTSDWIHGSASALAAASLGRTGTVGVWAQDAWSLASDWKLTVGARLEHWRAYDGLNYSAAPALNVAQPEVTATHVSPKASLAWTPSLNWRVTASYGDAYRFPTVQELYQAITTGVVLSTPNPNLRPEHARSGELSLEHGWTGGHARVSAFGEWVDDALISQTAPLVAGSTQLFSYVQNIGRTRALGLEAVAEQQDVLVKGLTLSGSAVYVDARTLSDPAFAAAVGKRLPQVPRWRATAQASYAATSRLTLSAAVRYASRVFATIDNSDPVTHTYQGFDGYLVGDLRATWRLNDHVTAAVGIDNLGSDNYFLFHPFPQRTVLAELKWTL